MTTHTLAHRSKRDHIEHLGNRQTCPGCGKTFRLNSTGLVWHLSWSTGCSEQWDTTCKESLQVPVTPIQSREPMTAHDRQYRQSKRDSMRAILPHRMEAPR